MAPISPHFRVERIAVHGQATTPVPNARPPYNRSRDKALSNRLRRCRSPAGPSARVQEIWDRLTGLYWGMETPALTLALNALEIVRYLITVIGEGRQGNAEAAILVEGRVMAPMAPSPSKQWFCSFQER